MKKFFIIITLILSISTNVQASRGDMLLDFFTWIGKVFETREAQLGTRTILKWFLSNKEYENNIRKETEKDFALEFDYYVSKYNKDWLNKQKLNSERIEKQAEAILILKKNLISRGYNNFLNNNFYLICNYKSKMYSFIFFEKNNTAFMHEAITPYRFIKNISINNEVIVFHSIVNDKTLIFANYKKNKKSFYNWYFLHFTEDTILFEHKVNYDLDIIDKPELSKDNEIYKFNNCEVNES